MSEAASAEAEAAFGIRRFLGLKARRKGVPRRPEGARGLTRRRRRARRCRVRQERSSSSSPAPSAVTGCCRQRPLPRRWRSGYSSCIGPWPLVPRPPWWGGRPIHSHRNYLSQRSRRTGLVRPGPTPDSAFRLPRNTPKWLDHPPQIGLYNSSYDPKSNPSCHRRSSHTRQGSTATPTAATVPATPAGCGGRDRPPPLLRLKKRQGSRQSADRSPMRAIA